MSRLERENLDLNWLHFPRNVDLIELEAMRRRKNWNKPLARKSKSGLSMKAQVERFLSGSKDMFKFPEKVKHRPRRVRERDKPMTLSFKEYLRERGE